MKDKTTKGLLFAIALGLWAHVALEWFHPVPLQAAAEQNETILRRIDSTLNLIANGVCVNSKIC